MTLVELRYIVAVARERHFGRAAEACYVSQPTLSVGVKKLEEELGVTLFERIRGDVSVTPLGEQIIEQAQRVLEQAASIKQLAQYGQDPLSGPLRLGAIYTIGPYLFPQLVPALHDSAADMPLIIEEDYTARLSERLKHGELDVIIVALPFEMPGVITMPLYDEPFVVVLPSSHPWCKRKTIAAEELASQTLLLLGAGHCFRDQVLEACPGCQQTVQEGDIHQTVEGSSLETVRHMVASGMGITVLPCTAVGTGGYEQTLLNVKRFQEPVPTRRVALAWRKSFPRREAIEVVQQAIRSCKHRCVSYL